MSGSFLDCTPSPDKALNDNADSITETPRKGLTARQQVFLELVQTESNYVNILNTINTVSLRFTSKGASLIIHAYSFFFVFVDV